MTSADDGRPATAAPKGFRFFLFASPQLALATLGLPIVIYLPAYYAGPVGLGLVATGLIFMTARFWDVLIDPLIGWAVDRFPTRWGRRKVWMIAATGPMIVATLALCFPPEGVGGAWLSFWLFFIYIWWMLIHICHLAWASELSNDYDERTAIQSRIMLVYFAGLLLVLTGPIIAAAVLGDSGIEQKVRAMGLYTAVLLPVTVAACCLVSREPDVPVASRTLEKMGWREAAGIVIGNPALLRVLGTDMFAGLSNGIASGLFVYFTAEVLRLERLTLFGAPVDPGFLLLITFVGAMAGVPLWSRLAVRVGKHRAVAASAMLNCAAFLCVILLPGLGFAWVALFYLVTGIAFGAPPFLDRAILGDVIDLDQTKTGAQRSGLLFALLTTTNKIGYALPVGLLFPALALVGFNPNGGNTPEAIAWLTAMFVVLPLLCNLAIIGLMWRFPIDRAVQAELRAQLARA